MAQYDFALGIVESHWAGRVIPSARSIDRNKNLDVSHKSPQGKDLDVYAKSTSDLHPGPILLPANPRASERPNRRAAQTNSTETIFVSRVPSIGTDTARGIQ